LPQVATPTPRPPTQINARAAELKAQLLKGRDARPTSATPPVVATIAGAKAALTEGLNSSHGSPNTPVTTAEKRDQELNVNELISQYSESKPAATASVKQENIQREASNPRSQQNSIQKELTAKSQGPSLGSPTKVAKTNGKPLGSKATLGKRHSSNGSLSEASEGEIREDVATPKTAKPVPPTKPKEPQTTAKNIQRDESRRPSREDQTNPPYPRGQRDDSPPRRPQPPNNKIQPPRIRDDRREETDRRPYDSYQPVKKGDRMDYIEAERPPYPRQESREEDFRRLELGSDLIRTDSSRQARELKPPTLDDLLPLDEDLREWLDITGYHNAPYRNKILGRRRAIAALDAQRDKLLAEMEAEERGGLPPVVSGQVSTSTMLPPPIPNKIGGREPTPSTAKIELTQRDRVVSNKRPYSDDREENMTGKFARLEDRNSAPRVNEEEDYDNRRPRSVDTRDDRDISRNRRDGRPRSRERDISPSRRAYENRPPARSKPYEEPKIVQEDRKDRPYVERGNYRGKNSFLLLILDGTSC